MQSCIQREKKKILYFSCDFTAEFTTVVLVRMFYILVYIEMSLTNKSQAAASSTNIFFIIDLRTSTWGLNLQTFQAFYYFYLNYFGNI